MRILRVLGLMAVLLGEDHTRIVVGKVVRVERIAGALAELDGPEGKF